jgi:small subunit ribosomal protein S3
MGQKVHPIGLRLGFIRTWSSRWYANKRDFSRFLHEDLKIRKHVFKTFLQAAIALVEVERASDKIRVNIHTARPGVIIGRKGADIDRLREELQKMTGNKEVHINIKEVKNPSANAQLVSDNIALQLEKRIAFRRAMKKAIQQAFDSGAKGIKIQTKGRLAGSEIARGEGYLEGSVPLHTLRADIDYGFSEAMTTYGKIGVKVLIYKGEIIDRDSLRPEKRDDAAQTVDAVKESQETSHAIDA